MAFRRLIVDRSPGLAWFGGVLLVAAYALMKAYHHSFAAMMDRGKVWLWLPLYGLAMYCVFRGAYGAWWRELRVDRDARRVRTADGHVVPFDHVGALSIEPPALRAAGVLPSLYRSAFTHDLERMRDALDAALGRGGSRPRVHRLRRLAYHRSWGLFVFTLVGFALLVLAVGEHLVFGHSSELEYWLLAGAGGATCLLWFRRALFGSRSANQLFVDVPAGLLQLADGRLRTFAELGALSVVERRSSHGDRQRRLVYYDLRAANLHDALFSHLDQERTQRRLHALTTAVLAHELRRVMEVAPDGDAGAGALRAAPALRAEIDRVAASSPYRAAALAELSRDPDTSIRDRARALAADDSAALR